jgi:hypothetical protein
MGEHKSDCGNIEMVKDSLHELFYDFEWIKVS